MWLKTLCCLVSACLMTACASWPTRSKPVSPPPANLAQPCPQLPLLTSKAGSAIQRWAIDVIRLYNDCADRKDALVEAWPES